MTQDEIILYCEKKFDEIVDKLIPENESTFKSFLKTYLNPIRLTKKDTEIIDVYRLMNEIKEKESTIISGLETDIISVSKYKEWQKQVISLYLTDILDNVVIDINDKREKIEFICTSLEDMPDIFTMTEDDIVVIENAKRIINRRKVKINLNEKSKNSIFYFELDLEKINKIYQFLNDNKYIEPNTDFAESFKIENKNKNIKSTWLKSERTLFVFLFLLNNKKILHNNNSLAIVSDDLFCRKGVISKVANSSTNLSKISNNLLKGDYLENKYLILYQKIAEILEYKI